MKNYFHEIGLWPERDGIARAYVIGFILSLALTLIAYELVVQAAFSRQTIIILVALLALVQFGVQVRFFLHLGRERSSRERLAILGAAILIVGILVSGSLWIMFSLNSRMMPDSTQMEQYMNAQLGF